METLKEQMINLGLAQQKSAEIKPDKNEVCNELPISELLSEKLIELIITKQPFGRLHNFLANKQMKLSKTVRKKLRLFYKASIDNNFLDSVALKAEIEKIDFDKAKESFRRRKDQKNARRSGKSKKRKNKRAIKPLMSLEEAKLTSQEKIAQLKATSKIGLGLESKLKIPKVKAAEVIIDKHTVKEEREDKSILYAAGWSLKHENDD